MYYARQQLSNLVVTFVLLSLCAASAFAQEVESFGLIMFTPPAGWTATNNNASRQYTHTKPDGTTYCAITLYGPMRTSGSMLSDFDQEWERRILAQSTWSESVLPTAHVTLADIEYVDGAANIILKKNSGSLYIRLAVIRIGNQRQSITFGSGSKLSLEEYQTELQDFMSGIKPDTTNVAK